MSSLSFASSPVHRRPFNKDASYHLYLLCARHCAAELLFSLILVTVLTQYYYPRIKDEETNSERLSNLPKVAQSWAARAPDTLWFQRPLPPSGISFHREKWGLEKLFRPKRLRSVSPKRLLVLGPALGNAVIWES